MKDESSSFESLQFIIAANAPGLRDLRRNKTDTWQSRFPRSQTSDFSNIDESNSRNFDCQTPTASSSILWSVVWTLDT